MSTTSRKITQGLAIAIATKMSAATYDPLIDKHRRRADRLIERCLENVYGRANLRKFRDLPAVFHDEPQANLYVVAGGERHTLWGSQVRVVPPHRGVPQVKDEALAAEVSAWGRELERLKTEKKEARTKIENAVLAHGTEKRLRENWPEAAAHLPEGALVLLPAVPVELIMAQLRSARTPPEGARA